MFISMSFVFTIYNLKCTLHHFSLSGQLIAFNMELIRQKLIENAIKRAGSSQRTGYISWSFMVRNLTTKELEADEDHVGLTEQLEKLRELREASGATLESLLEVREGHSVNLEGSVQARRDILGILKRGYISEVEEEGAYHSPTVRVYLLENADFFKLLLLH